MKTIIFNSDVGEEAGFDEEIMPYVSWCNISCGGHAGNEEVIRRTVDLALKHDVRIGAHPSYPDKENFGRKSLKMPYNDLVDIISEQIQLVKFNVESIGGELHHVKPHGALYNDAVKNESIAMAIVDSIKNIDKSLAIITLKDSRLAYIASEFLEVKYEAFADRNYNKDLSLVSRLQEDALIDNPEKVFQHVLRMVKNGKVKTLIGEELPVFFDTICVHGDQPKSVEILMYMRKKFSELNFGF